MRGRRVRGRRLLSLVLLTLLVSLFVSLSGYLIYVAVSGAAQKTPPQQQQQGRRRAGVEDPQPTELPTPEKIEAFAKSIEDIDDSLAASAAVEFVTEVASADAPPAGVQPAAVRSMVFGMARTVIVSVASEHLAKFSMKAITALVVQHGSISTAALRVGAQAGTLLLADTLYRCLADDAYGEQRTEATCSDQGYVIASAILSPSSVYELAKKGKGLVKGAARPLAIGAARSASRFAAKASSVALRLSKTMGTRVGARVGAVMARFSTRMAAAATRMAARAAAQAATMGARMQVEASLGPVGIVIIVLELVFLVVSLTLDMLCVGNFGEDCHVTAEELAQLNNDQRQMMVAALETSSLVDLILEVDTGGWTGYSEARAYMRGAYVSKNKAAIARIFGTDTVAEWFAGLSDSDMLPSEALAMMTDFKDFVDSQNDTAIYAAEILVPCRRNGGTVLSGVCTATKATCFAYTDAVESLVGKSGAAFSSAAKFATIQLSILFTSSIRLAVDLHMASEKKYTDKLIDSVARCIRSVRGRVATFEDAIGAMRAVDADVAEEIAQILEPSDWTVVDDSFAARAEWAHESAHVRRESFRWVERVQRSLRYLSPSEARASANTEGVCIRDPAAAMNLHVCPYIVADTKKSGSLKYVVDKDVPAHAVNWKTGACTRTARYCEHYDMHDVSVINETLGETLAAGPDVSRACSESDDRRAVCTCGKSGAQKFGAFFVGDTIQGYVNKNGLGLGVSGWANLL
jgi:hypothetical protein